jgi:hypothetical protein
VQIHNPERKDRAALTETWTVPYGIKLPTFSAIMKPNGAEGCLLSHAAVAKKLNAPYIVLEDDAVPTEAANSSTEVVAALGEIMRSQKYDLIYLGGLPLLGAKKTEYSGIYEGQCWTTYAMVVGPVAANFLRSVQYDGTPIDVVLARQGFTSAFLDPPLFRQALTPSQIGKSAFTKGLLWAKILNTATPWWRWVAIHSDTLVWVLVLFAIILVQRLNALPYSDIPS